MTCPSKQKSTAELLAEFKRLFGAPPVLSTENLEAYEQLLIGFIEENKPTTHLEKMGVRYMADDAWEEARCKRHKILSAERTYRGHVEAQMVRRKLAAETAKRKEDAARMRAEEANQPATLLGRISEVDDVLQEGIGDVDAIVASPSERDYARAFQAGIKFYRHLDQIQNNSRARFNNSYELFERGRNLREQLQRDQITEGESQSAEPEPKQVAAPPSPAPGEDK